MFVNTKFQDIFSKMCAYVFVYLHAAADKQLLNGMIDNVSDEMGHKTCLCNCHITK